MAAKTYRQITSLEALKRDWPDLSWAVLIDLPLEEVKTAKWKEAKIENTFFLGCHFDGLESQTLLAQREAAILPPFKGLPYEPFRYELYAPEELLKEVAPDVSRDHAIYCDYIAKGRWSADLIENLCRRIHDDGIDDAIEGLRRKFGPERFVGFMGGSSNPRSDPFYRKTAQAARLLTLDGYFVVSGGGPGMMEAANLGAYLAKRSEADLDTAIEILKKADTYSDIKNWTSTALEVKSKFGKGCDSLGIPTWFYGFEPTNMFATHIGKYFDNNVREGGLVQIGRRAVIFAPGSAGTRQEIFMDAAQNHYGTTGQYTPMIFLGLRQYAVDAPVYALIQTLATTNYKNLLIIEDEPEEIVKFIKTHPPVPKP